MTQDQYGQTREPGYVARGDAVPDDENEEYASRQSKPMTRFQKVASALRGADPEQDEQGDYWDEPAASAADRDEAVAVTNPNVPVPETGTDPLTRQDQVTGPTSPDAADHPATQPDMFGTTAHGGNGATSAPYPEGQVGEATNGARATGASAGTESRPGEAAGMLGDFSDLTYRDLLPDAAQYAAQWQQVQFKFVDDPHASVTEAADIIAQVTARLEAAIQQQQRSLRGRWGEGTNAGTEALRETLRMYRTFLDQLIGSRAG
jgi:hypothetical protein